MAEIKSIRVKGEDYDIGLGGGAHPVKTVELWSGSWESGTISVPGASEYDLFIVSFSNSDNNIWPVLTYASTNPNDEYRTIFASLAEAVSSSIFVTVTANIFLYGDEMNLGFKSNVLLSKPSSPYSITSNHPSRIVRIEGVALNG